MLNYLYWDPSRALLPWNIPILGRPILWYGFLFALGFFLSYLVLLSLLRHDKLNEVKTNAKKIADSITLYTILGAVIGARIFDVLFYENWMTLIHDPLSVFRVWEGGLASHGGVLGVLIAFIIFQRKHHYFSGLHLLDIAVVPAGIASCCIRLGNFFNQEILGKPTDMPWAIVFGHPADGSYPVPRHPVQLYEAAFYLVVFVILWSLRKSWKKEGSACGLFMILVFGFRFLIEFFKEEQSFWMVGSPVSMGQLLSVPFILFGCYLMFRKKRLD
jgi:phosphatidylglycerol---prolipoprotein diacylglyceryl transferase